MSNVVCLMNVEAERATFTWSEGPAFFEPFTLDRLVYKEFKELAETARQKLANLVKDYLYDEENVPTSSYELAEAGYELYEALFDPGADQLRQARQVRKWLENLALQHEVDALEIVVESPWSLPWNVIYDQEPDKEAFLSGDDSPDRWRPFWGLRYDLCGGRKVDPLRRAPILKDPRVLMVVDPEIRDGLPEQQQQRLAEFASKHDLQVVNTKEELKAATKAARPDLMYWLSHAEPDALILSNEPVSPRNLRKMLKQDDDLAVGGLAFLNACQTAEGAGAEGSFFEALHSVGFAGMIGTEHQTIDQFANPLGLDFLEAFLDRGEPVGAVLRQLRGRVPLGLLYGTYCPPDIRIEKDDARDGLEISQIRHLEGVALGVESTSAPPLPREPYRSLAYYERGDRALFAGRDDDIERFATLLDDATTRMLVLHGESGVGKSSFLHAGVIPFLEEECLGYRFIRDPSRAERQDAVIFIRATNDLFGQLAQSVCDFCARPYEYQTPLGDSVAADLPAVLRGLIGDEVHPGTLRAALSGDSALLGRILSEISDRLPFAAILIMDQGEEVFTLAQTPEDQQRGRSALDMLRRTVQGSGNFKVILSLRTEYYGRVIDRLRRGLQDTGNIREYLLTDFDEAALVEAIRRPTAREKIPYTSEVPFEKYGFGYAEGVAEEIAYRVIRHTTHRHDSVLPLVQVICAQLYELARQRDDRTITSDELQALGGIEGGMRNHVEGLLSQLLKDSPLDKKPLQKLFTQLYLQQPDGTLTTALLSEEEVHRRWTGRMPFDELLRIAREMRLLKVNSLRIGSDEERHYVSLGHDALAKLAAEWDEELTRAARFRKMAAIVAGVSSVAVVMTVLAGWAYAERNKAIRQSASILVSTDAPAEEFNKIFPDLVGHRGTVLSTLQQIVDLQPEEETGETSRLKLGRKRADAAIAMFRLQDASDAVEVLRVNEDPESLTQFVHRCKEREVLFGQLRNPLYAAMKQRRAAQSVRTSHAADESTICYGLLLALGEFDINRTTNPPDAELLEQLEDWYGHDPSSAIHSACGWLLQKWGYGELVQQAERRLARESKKKWFDATKEWFVLEINTAESGEPDYFTFVVFQPGVFMMGSPVKEEGRGPDPAKEEQHYEKIRRPFALCDREVTHWQLKRRIPEAESGYDRDITAVSDFPATYVSWKEAEEYCRLLTERGAQSLLDREQVPPEFRLPLEKEWEYACRAAAITPFSFGNDRSLFDRYAWSNVKEAEELHDVATLRPNLRGLFDIHGNVKEWCEDLYAPYGAPPMPPELRVVRGGGGSPVDTCRSAARAGENPANDPGEYFGFRLCIQLPESG